MNLSQNDLEHLRDMVDQGRMTVEQANVEKVRAMRVMLVTSRLSADVRRALNAAVKRGELARIAKDGHKPEAYYHPTFEYLVAGERNRHAESVLAAVRSVMA